MIGKRILMALALMAGAACSSDPTAPIATPGELAINGLVTRVTIDRPAVERGGEFTVTYTVTNIRKEPVELVIDCGRIAQGIVYRGRREVQMVGSGSGCFPAWGSLTIAAGDEHAIRWWVSTTIRDWSTEHGIRSANAEAGHYIFRVEPNVARIGGERARLPGMGVGFQVR